MSYSVAAAVPSKLIPQQPVSTGQAIIKKTQMEYPPTTINDFYCLNAGGSQNEITFRISSNDFILWDECHFRLPLWTWNAVAPGSATQTYLDIGGVHALFKKIEIRAQASGVEIQKMDNYNLIVAQNIINGHLMDPEDSLQRDWESLEMSDHAMIPFGSVGSEAAAGAFVPVYSQVSDPLDPHDNLFSDGTGAGTVGEANARQKRELTFLPYMSFFRHGQPFPLFLFPGGIEIKLTLDNSYISGFRMAVLPSNSAALARTEFHYKISRPRFVAQIWEVDGSIIRDYEAQYATEGGLVYVLPNWEAVQSQVQGVNAGSTPVYFTASKRSVRRGYGLIQYEKTYDGTSYNVAAYANSNRTLSHGLLTQIYEYSFTVGSQDYPQSKQKVRQNLELTIANIVTGYSEYPSELVRAIRKILSRRTLGVHPQELMPDLPQRAVGWRLDTRAGLALVAGGASDASGLPHRRYYGALAAATGGTLADNLLAAPAAVGKVVSDRTETMCCQFPVNFSRDESFLCGVDLTQVPLVWTFTRSAAPVVLLGNNLNGNYIYRVVFQYDSLLQINSQGVYVLQ